MTTTITDTTTDTADVRFIYQGSVTTIEVLSEAGQEWMDSSVAAEPWQWLGPVLCVDSRFTEDLISAATDDGLIVEK